MYSVVLMMALSGGAETPALFGRSKGCCSPCEPVSCCGCEGRRSRRSKGCCGAVECCAPVSCCGCEGRRSRRHKSCCGCCAPAPACGCCGAVSTCSTCGAAPACSTCGAAPACATCGASAAPVEVKPEAVPAPKGDKGKGEQASIVAPATIVVSLPQEAKLSVGDYVVQSGSASRTLTSPVLDAGQEYVYSLKAEIVRDGKTVTTSKDITVRAGDEVNVALDFPVVVALR